MKKKLLSILLMAVFLTGLFVLPPPVMAATTTNWGKINRDNKTSEFQSLEFNITSPGKSTVYFHTEKIFVQIGPYKATLDGQTYFPGIYNGAATFMASILAAAAGTNTDALSSIINDPNYGVNLSAEVGIYANGKKIATITDPSQIKSVCGSNGHPGTCGYYFSPSDQASMITRWGVAYDPDPPKQVDLEAIDITVRDDNNNSVSTVTPGKQYRISATFRNSSNLQCSNANIRMYFQGNGDPDMKPIGSETQSVGINSQISNTQSWVFTATEGNNGLTATINRDYHGYGCWKNNPFKSGSNSYTEQSYDNNVFTLRLSAAKTETKSTGLSPAAYDLAAVSGTLTDSNGNSISTAETGKTYSAKAVFRSDFTVGGYATVRLYRLGSSLTLLSTNSLYIPPGPNREVYYTWTNISVQSGQNTFFATIDIKENGDCELFDGKYDEARWDNNSVKIDATGSTTTTSTASMPYYPNYGSSSFYFPEFVPAHEEIRVVKKTVPVYGWKEVPFKKAKKPKITVRLVQ